MHHSDDWDESLSPQDILMLAKQAHNPLKTMSVYDTIISAGSEHFQPVVVTVARRVRN